MGDVTWPLNLPIWWWYGVIFSILGRFSPTTQQFPGWFSSGVFASCLVNSLDGEQSQQLARLARVIYLFNVYMNILIHSYL